MIATFEPITITPQAIRYGILLTAKTQISHHDSSQTDDSNRNLFNRQLQIQERPGDGRVPTPAQVETFAATYPVPVEIVDWFDDISFPDFVAAAFVRLFLDIYNSRDGQGLFSDTMRYERLESRLQQAAVMSHADRSRPLKGIWDRLTGMLQVGIHPSRYDKALLDIQALPPVIQHLARQSIERGARSLIALAREWHQAGKLQSDTYAEATGQMKMSEDGLILAFDERLIVPGSPYHIGINVPHISANSLRHELVREPAWVHLCRRLGLQPGVPGRGGIPSGAEGIFYNGGNIKAGAKGATDAFWLSQQIRQVYASIDLLGGTTDAFDTGESKLKVGSYLVCAENADKLADTPAADLPLTSMSVFDMVDDVTHTRMAGKLGEGQMIFGFESLAAGAQIYVTLDLDWDTDDLTRGALLAALETYDAGIRTIGGQAARGFGFVRMDFLHEPESDKDYQRLYEEHIDNHREALIEGLTSGKLGTDKVVVS